MPCETFTSYALLRSLLNSGSEVDVAQAVAYGRRIKVYPLAEADDPPETVFVDGSDVVFDATIPYDRRFFQSLDRVIQREPWLARDRAHDRHHQGRGHQKGRDIRFLRGAPGHPR